MDLVVARVGKAHSLRGEVTVQLHTDEPHARFVPGTRFATEAQPGSGVPRELTLRGARLHNGTWLLAFEEIPDRTGAEGLRGTLLRLDLDDAGADRAERAERDDEEDAWYEDELVGLAAVSPSGKHLGEVTGLEIGAAQDLLVLLLTDGATAYLPFVAAIVPEVDVEGHRIVVDAPPGLLDLNRD